MKVALGLTHRCNLSCDYCYAGKKFKRDMSEATARRAVDFALEKCAPGQELELSFFGGEPFLCFDVMKSVTRYLRMTERGNGTSARLSITTNGTVLAQAMLDFLREEDVSLCISIDGPAHVHNKHRRFRNGRGSFSHVLKNLRASLRQISAVQVNAVYDAESLALLPEIVTFLSEIGAPAIHLNMNIYSRWKDASFEKFQDAYMAIARYYVKCYLSGQEIAVNLIDSKMVLFLKGGYSFYDRCGMGDSEWGVAPSGNIYPCERFIGEDNNTSLCLGNVHTGFDVASRCAVVEHRGNRNQECKTCTFRKYCMNWCGCTNYFMTGHTDLADAALCASERAAVLAAEHVFSTLSATENELFLDHLMRYLHEASLKTPRKEGRSWQRRARLEARDLSGKATSHSGAQQTNLMT